jgi:integrase
MAEPRKERTAYRQIYRRVSATGKVKYQIEPRIKGYDGGCETFERLTDARERMDEIRVQVRQGKLSSGRRHLREAIAEYSRKELPRLAVTERRNRRRHLAFWENALGTVKLAELRRQDVIDALGTILASFSTRNRYKAALSAVLSAAVEWEWLRDNPLHLASRRKRAKGEREPGRNREITQEEWARLVPALKASRDPRLYVLTVCAAASGAREGELMRLERLRLRFDGDAPSGIVAFTKNGEEKTLYFPGVAGELLRAWNAQGGSTPYVFDLPGAKPVRCSGTGAPTLYGYPAGCEECGAIFLNTRLSEVPAHHPVPAFPQGAWRYAKKRAGISDLRLHDFRKAWAVWLKESGVDDTDAQILGGWKSRSMVLYYSRQAHKRGGAAVQKLLNNPKDY